MITISDTQRYAIANGTVAAKQQEVANALAARCAALFTQYMLQNGQFETGALANSTYIATNEASGYAAAAANATSRNPDVVLLDDIGPSEPGSAVAAIAASYAEPQNYGTGSLPARPFFEPATEIIDALLDDAIAQAWNELVSG